MDWRYAGHLLELPEGQGSQRLSNKTSWMKKQLNQERRWKGKDVPERGASVAKEGKARNSIVCIGNYIEVNGTRRASLK